VARLYANEHFPARAVAELRRLGHDVLTVQETGRANLRWPDAEVFPELANLIHQVLNQEASFVGRVLRVYRPHR